MGCNRDSGCSTLAKVTYPKLRESIDNSFRTINVELTDTVDTLSSLKIPEDYLGVKVKEKLDEIIALFGSDITDLQTANSNVDNFIDLKIKEHKQHYKLWKELKNAELSNTSIIEDNVGRPDPDE